MHYNIQDFMIQLLCTFQILCTSVGMNALMDETQNPCILVPATLLYGQEKTSSGQFLVVTDGGMLAGEKSREGMPTQQGYMHNTSGELHCKTCECKMIQDIST